jgi:hypothetical protein
MLTVILENVGTPGGDEACNYCVAPREENLIFKNRIRIKSTSSGMRAFD